MTGRRVPALLCALALLAGTGLACRTHDALHTAPSVFPRERAHARPEHPADILSYGIELELLPESRSIHATCRVGFRALERLEALRLELLDLEVEEVRDADGRALAFRHERGELRITLAKPLDPRAEGEVRVRYGGRPRRGLWFAGRRADGSGPTLVFSHGETEDSRGWFPCVEAPGERATTELLVTLPAGWIATATGARVATEEGADGRRRERWRMDFPYPAYLVGLAAGELVQEEGRAEDVPLTFLAEPRYREWIEPTFEETDEILAFVADYTGRPYPFPKYSQVAVDNFPWGGMENLSATTLTPLLLTDERGRADQPPFLLVAHEAAHQWFGDLLTCADWSELWLNEGFATYFALLYLEHTRGVDEFRAQLREAQEAYLAQDVGPKRRPTVWNVWREADDVFDTRPYQGGAARLDLLRFLLGDEVFQNGVRDYVAANEGRGVVTGDLRRSMERVSGRDLAAFFETWLTRPGFPEFAFAWEWDQRRRELRLEVAQIQSTDDGTPEVFELPVEVEVRTPGGSRDFRLALARRNERFVLPCAERPLYVRFDKHGRIPKRLREDKAPEEWLAIARGSDDVNGRREAVLNLAQHCARVRVREGTPPEELAGILECLRDDGSPWVRADAATALGLVGGPEAEEALRRAALEDDAPRARAAALRALAGFGVSAGLSSLAEDVFAEAPSYQVMGAAAALFCQAAPERAFDFLEAALERESPHDTLAGLLLAELAGLADGRVPEALRRHASDPRLAPTARAVAVRRLGEAYPDLETSRFLVPFLEEESFHLRGAAVSALASLGDDVAARALRGYYPRARTSSERRSIEALLERREL